MWQVIAIVVFITFASSLPNRKRDDNLRVSRKRKQSLLIKRQNNCPTGYSPCKGGCCDDICGPKPELCEDDTCCRAGEICTDDGGCE
ncbi:10157_t:CDS:2 [Funneliformis mosseae]|uniref:10157_t:CDS:1 n=1 Tax=Funneliformis mosseae TaxID=27381 RepID=A0A9N9CKD4_FUNMO|nr:10157_t:CDS:2 [Funneliformis mosseae]